MGAPRNLYVNPDPLVGVNAAGGGLTLADPYLTVQYCIDDITITHGGRNAANGDQINVIEGTDDTPAATLNLATVGAVYGAPTVDAPLIFRGCDHYGNYGVGGIDGGAGGFSIYDGVAGATDYVHFVNMHPHNTAAANVVYLRDSSSLINCEIDTTTGLGVRTRDFCTVAGCHFHDCENATASIQVNGGCKVQGNYIDTGIGAGIYGASSANLITRNTVVCAVVTSTGIVVGSPRHEVIGNSILSTAAGTNAGIRFTANTHSDCSVMDNLIEGFNGAGAWAAAINFGTLLRHVVLYANNSFYDCNEPLHIINDCDKNYDEDNEVLAASPFLKEGALSFANRFNYFKPAIPVRGRAFPNGCRFDRGAVQVRLAVERTIPAQVIATIPERVVLDSL